MTDVPRQSEMMMPVSDEHAMKMIEIEALRQITDNLKRLNDCAQEQGKTLHSIDLRLTRIESNTVNADVAALKLKVDLLESQEDRRAGAKGFADWMLRNGPVIFGLLAVIFVVLKANGKI